VIGTVVHFVQFIYFYREFTDLLNNMPRYAMAPMNKSPAAETHHRIEFSDARTLSSIKDASIDLVVTSPQVNRIVGLTNAV
jgi:hypothetical protein